MQAPGGGDKAFLGGELGIGISRVTVKYRISCDFVSGERGLEV